MVSLVSVLTNFRDGMAVCADTNDASTTKGVVDQGIECAMVATSGTLDSGRSRRSVWATSRAGVQATSVQGRRRHRATHPSVAGTTRDSPQKLKGNVRGT